MTNIKCVLIDPPRRLVNISDKGGIKESGEQEAIYPPMGLAYIAAVLRENGVEVKIIDAKSLNMSHEDVAKAIEKERPDFAGVTVFTTQLRSALDTCRGIKKRFPSTKIVVGGPHIHPLHGEVIKEESIDFCVRGEAELTMLELVNTVSNGDEGDLKKVKGLTFKNGNNIIVTPDRPFIQNLDTLPFPARDLLPIHLYKAGTARGVVNFTPVTASRGCPFKCHFCSVPRFWPIHRRRSVENVLNELEDVYRTYKIELVRFTDETFTLNKRWVTEFCRGMVERGLADKITWSCDSRVNTISEELLKEMKSANCEVIFYGIEFGNQRILDFSGKKTTIAQIHKAVEMTKKSGISPYGGFMLGYPTETCETIEDTIKLARTVGVDGATFTVVTPFPGSQLYDYCEEKGLLRTHNLEQFNYASPANGIIALKDVTNEELIKLYEHAHVEFYFRHIRDKLIQDMQNLLEVDMVEVGADYK